MFEVRKTACSRDCPDACSMLVHVENAGSEHERALRLDGCPDDPMTQGFLCERTNLFLSRQYSADRFLSPMVRRDGRLEPLSFANALDLAASRLDQIRRESGGAAILHYRSGGSLGLLKHLSDYLFALIGPATVKHGDICSGAGEAAQDMDFGISESHDIEDLRNARMVILWGKNPHVSGPHLLPLLREIKANGVHLVGIDPVRTKTHVLCDEFLMPRPGGDGALACGIARRIFERGAVHPSAAVFCANLDEFRSLVFSRPCGAWADEAGLSVADIDRSAELCITRRPFNIQVGWGMGRRQNGAAIVRAVDALAAICGNIGVPGGGSTFYYGRRRAFDFSFADQAPAAPRSFAETLLGQEILSATQPPIRATWVTAGNPVTMLPDSDTVRRAFAGCEFNVVVDTHPTDTTDLAHLIFPTRTILEDDDLLGSFGSHFLRASTPALNAPIGVPHELEIWQGLADRLGVGACLKGSVAEWKDRLLAKVSGRGVTRAALARGPIRNPDAERVLFSNGRTRCSDGRIHLLDRQPGPPPKVSQEWPLLLLAVSTSKAQSSQWAVDPTTRPLEVRVHPDAVPGFLDGTPARLESVRGSLDVLVRLDTNVHPEAALVPKGGMLRQGRCTNALVRAVESDAGGGAAYYDEPVRVVRRI